ncbi:MAG: HD domain-containing phosphohydrolase [Betaproteobacteria bacterium]
MKQKVLVQDLKPGMYVNELDRPWLDTPYLFQGFLVQSQQDIDEVGKYCDHVFVDPLKAQYAGQTSRLGFSLENDAEQTVKRGPIRYADKGTVESELPRAKQVSEQAVDVINRIRLEIEDKPKFAVKHATVLIESMVDSIVDNPDALLLLTRLRQSDSSSYDHAIEVAIFMLAYGRQMGFPREELSLLGLAGLLLDIGKIKLPKELLEKASPYSPAEHSLMKRHVAFGEAILRASPGISATVIDIVSQHHEREDGSGYPRGLLHGEISVYGKMATIVDVYRELTSPNPSANAGAFSPYDALQTMHGWAGKFFHPGLLEQFVQCIGIYPVGSLVELNTGDVAIVIAHSRVRRLRPRIMLILNAKKLPHATPVMLDLMDNPTSPTAGIRYEVSRGLETGMYGIDPKDYYL